jgi:hypothetical protein
LIEINAPARFPTAEIATATRGLNAPVAIDVAIAFAVSWNPFVKSNASATTITMINRSSEPTLIEATHPEHTAVTIR